MKQSLGKSFSSSSSYFFIKTDLGPFLFKTIIQSLKSVYYDSLSSFRSRQGGPQRKILRGSTKTDIGSVCLGKSQKLGKVKKRSSP